MSQGNEEQNLDQWNEDESIDDMSDPAFDDFLATLFPEEYWKNI